MSTRDGDPNSTITAVVGLVGSVLLVAIVVGLQALYYHIRDEEEAKKLYSKPPQELASLRATEQGAMNSYRWIDQSRGIVGIPIDRAIELTGYALRADTTSGRGNRP